MKKMVLPVICAGLMFSSFADANPISRGWYLGAGTGSTSIDDEGAFINNGNEDNSFKIIAGYQFNKIVAIESQYTNYGDIEYGNISNGLGGSLRNYTLSPTTISIAANLGYSFSSGLRPFGILGLGLIDLDQSGLYLEDDETLSIRYGFGLEYMPSFSKKVSLRVGYEADFFLVESYNYWSDDYDVHLSSLYLNVNVRF